MGKATGARLRSHATPSTAADRSRYFGRAKELPGVKELIEAAKPKPAETSAESRTDMRKVVNAAYYGYNTEEEEAELVAYESKREAELREEMAKKGDEDDPDWEPLPGDTGNGEGWDLPTLDEVREELVQRKRRKLLDQLGAAE